jgi:transposase-like protein
MGLSRRQCTREFKLNALRRLEMGVPIAELARAIEVNPNTLHRWRREHLEGPGMRFPDRGKRAGRRAGSRSCSARWDNRLWRLIF